VRVIGGEYKGRIIEVSKDFDSRPTTDFAREALFNILSNHFDFSGIRFLDLFSGTGSVSIECYSRGCRQIDLVDTNGKAIHGVGKLATKLGIQGIHLVKLDAFRFIHVCKKQYHLIFADPPFDLKNLSGIPDAILGNNLLLPGGWLVLEHPKNHHFEEKPDFFDERKYGSVHFSFFRA